MCMYNMALVLHLPAQCHQKSPLYQDLQPHHCDQAGLMWQSYCCDIWVCMLAMHTTV